MNSLFSLIVVAVILFALSALDGSISRVGWRFWCTLGFVGYLLYKTGVVSVVLPWVGGRSHVLSSPVRTASHIGGGEWILLALIVFGGWLFIGALFKSFIGKGK